MIPAFLSAAFAWFLLYEWIPLPLLICICMGLFAIFVYFSRHKHSQFLPVDMLAQKSRLKNVNPTLKFWTLLTLMIISAASSNYLTGIFLVAAMLTLTVFGGLSIHNYFNYLTLPFSFLLIGGIALLFETSPSPVGAINFNIFGLWFSVTGKSQAHTALIMSRAFGAVSCLCCLSLTTPMPDIIGVLRRARCPELVIDLMYLIYRYIFILLSLHHDMLNAAKSRLGFRDYPASLRVTGKIYANLLIRSYQIAGKNFDAMESRCYDTGIRFLEQRNQGSFSQVASCVLLVAVSLCISFMGYL